MKLEEFGPIYVPKVFVGGHRERSLRRDQFSAYLNRLEDIVDPYIGTILANLKEKNASDLIELIRKRRTALFLSSGMKPEILGICKQILSFGVAGLALSLGFADRFRYLPPTVQKAIIIGGIFYIDMLIHRFGRPRRAHGRRLQETINRRITLTCMQGCTGGVVVRQRVHIWTLRRLRFVVCVACS